MGLSYLIAGPGGRAALDQLALGGMIGEDGLMKQATGHVRRFFDRKDHGHLFHDLFGGAQQKENDQLKRKHEEREKTAALFFVTPGENLQIPVAQLDSASARHFAQKILLKMVERPVIEPGYGDQRAETAQNTEW